MRYPTISLTKGNGPVLPGFPAAGAVERLLWYDAGRTGAGHRRAGGTRPQPQRREDRVAVYRRRKTQGTLPPGRAHRGRVRHGGPGVYGVGPGGALRARLLTARRNRPGERPLPALRRKGGGRAPGKAAGQQATAKAERDGSARP